MTRCVRRALLLAALLALAPASSHAARSKPKPSQELTQLREKIADLKREIDSVEGSKVDVLDQLKDSERAISQINRSLHDLAAEQHATAAELTAAQADSTRLRNHVRSQQDLLAKLFFQQYVHHDQDPFRMLLNLEDPNEISRQGVYYGYLSRSRATLITNLKRDLDDAEAAESVVREKHLELKEIRDEQQAEKNTLQKEANARRTTLAKLDKQISARRKQVAQWERDEKRLTQLVERLARVLAAKPRTPRAKARPTPSAPSYAKLKGHLPVAGELSNHFGGPRPDTGTPWKGWFIRAAAGSPIKALDEGRVVFADWLRGFGNLLIIDHGDGYLSLYGYNEALLKHEGDRVQAGETIANAGNSGGNAESGLYFEVRFKSQPIDPIQWVNNR